MRIAWIGLLFMCASVEAVGATPSCDAEKRNESGVFRPCKRPADTAPCLDLLIESPEIAKDPNWNWCAWPLFFTTGLSLRMPIPKTIHVMFVASWINSERADKTIDVELADHQHRIYQRKDVPVVIEDGQPLAKADFGLKFGEDLIGVPTAEVVERGGTRTMTHSFK